MPKGNPSAGLSGSVDRLFGSAAGTVDSTSGKAPPANTFNDLNLSPEEAAASRQKQFKLSSQQLKDFSAKASTFEKSGNLVQALKYYYQAYLIRAQFWGSADQVGLDLLLKIGDLNAKRNEKDYAEVCYKKYLASVAKAHGPGSFESVPALKHLAQLYLDNKRFSDAASYWRRVLALQERHLGENNLESIASRSKLIEADIKGNDYQGAAELLPQALAAEAAKHSDQTETYCHLLEQQLTCLNSLNRSAEAAQVDEKYQALKERLDAAKASASKSPETQSAGANAPGTKVTGPTGADASPAKVAEPKGADAIHPKHTVESGSGEVTDLKPFTPDTSHP